MAGQLVAIQAFDSNGVPAAGAKFYTYAAGTTTPKAAYSDEAGTIALSNPVVCNAAGIAACYLKSGIGDYKIALKDSTGAVFLFRTIDNYTPDTDSILYIIGSDIETARTEALDAAEAAQLAQSLAETAQAAAEAAQLAAENAETGAASSVSAAAASASAAATSATNAATSATASATSATASATSASAASTAKTNAETAETNAETAQAAAEAAVTNAQGVLADVSEYVTTVEDTPVPSAAVWTFNPATAVNTGTDKIARTAHPYFDGQLVKYTHGGGTAIGGLTTATLYYIKAPGANDFQLSASRGGAALNLTSTGAGTAHTLADVFSLLHYAEKAQASADDAQGHEVGAAQIVASMEEFVLGAYANATSAWANPNATANQSIYYNTTSGDWRVLGASAPAESILAQYNTAYDAILTALDGGTLPSGVVSDQATAEAGVNNTKAMTPLRVAQAIDAQAPQETVASQAEAEAGSENTKMMTALRTAQAIVANVLDEDAFTTDSATKAASQQSIGAYIKARGTIPQSVPATGVAGTADAITLTVTGGPTLADGLSFLFQPEAANTGNVTINYNSGGAVQLLDGDGAALAADALKTTAPIVVRYDNAAAKWRLLSGGASAADLPWVSVADYGAVGGNASADTTGFQNAIASGARVVYVPYTASAYLINAQLTLSANQRLLSLEGATIQKAFNGDLLNMNANYCGLDGVLVTGAGATYTGRGVVIASGTDQFIRNSKVYGMAGYCLEFTADDAGARFRAENAMFRRDTSVANYDTTAYAVKCPGTDTNGNRYFHNCYTEGGAFIDLSGGSNIQVIGCAMTTLAFGSTSSRCIVTSNRIASLGNTITVNGNDNVFDGNVVAGNIAIASGASRCSVGPGNVYVDNGTVSDAATATGNDVNRAYDLVVSITPTFGADVTNPTLGTGGSVSGLLVKQGRLVVVTISMTPGGAGWNAGSGDWWFQLPSPYSNWTPATGAFMGNCRVLDSGTGFYGGVARLVPADNKIRPYTGDFAANGIRGGTPITWASGDALELTVVYFIG